ncbi:MAG: 50S ribosomal protein L9 [Clostridia bacterium]|jgi:large subunit ribosomal protein L9
MKVILKQDVKSLGTKESMVNVSDGYARNFLIPKGLAVEVNPSNINIMNTKKESIRIKKDKELAAAKALSDKISKVTVILKAKSGDNGKLFGSITSKDIANQLKTKYDLDIDKKKIALSETIKETGDFNVEIKLYPTVVASLKVKIMGEEE